MIRRKPRRIVPTISSCPGFGSEVGTGRRNALRPGQIVVLNGVPRAGKSSIAAVIQETFDGPWMNLGVDVARQMTPQRYQPGIGLRPNEPAHAAAPLVATFYAALYDSVAAHSRLGLNVVVDIGHHDLSVLGDCARRLAGLPVLFVGVRCPLDVIMSRRSVNPSSYATGTAAEPVPPQVRAWQELVHDPGIYDIEVDTSVLPLCNAPRRSGGGSSTGHRRWHSRSSPRDARFRSAELSLLDERRERVGIDHAAGDCRVVPGESLDHEGRIGNPVVGRAESERTCALEAKRG
jgi:chloramphenicol 3-O phosphotransferase